MSDATNVFPSRRAFLEVLAGSAAVAGLAACGSSTSEPAAVRPGAPFAEPTVLRSANGKLAVRLVAKGRLVRFGSGYRFAYTYNGSVPGPTLRVRPGDVLTITLVNQLDQPTNLHTHGLHVSPSGNADNVFVMVAPGESRTYDYEIPADHPSGLFWYHPHHHGKVAEQVFGGLAGAIVVADELDDLPEIAASRERLMVIADPPLTENAGGFGASMMEKMQGREGDVVTVNGIVAPTVRTTAGTLERWRLLNASASRYYRVGLVDHPLHLIATDAGRLATPVTVDEVLLAPGERAEVLVTPTTAGRYALQALPYDRGAAMMMGGGGSSEHPATTLAT
ncbi:MAG: multicopper oxidase domain-containing protein, partial [Devosia sp.]